MQEVPMTTTGQSFMHAKAFEYLVKTNALNCNVKFLLEVKKNPPSLEEFCLQNKELLKCDTILVSDTSMLGSDMPSITTGLRGLAYWQIEVTARQSRFAFRNFRRRVANPITELTKLYYAAY